MKRIMTKPDYPFLKTSRYQLSRKTNYLGIVLGMSGSILMIWRMRIFYQLFRMSIYSVYADQSG